MSLILLQNVTVRYDGRPVLRLGASAAGPQR
jgi:hypothetical protein